MVEYCRNIQHLATLFFFSLFYTESFPVFHGIALWNFEQYRASVSFPSLDHSHYLTFDQSTKGIGNTKHGLTIKKKLKSQLEALMKKQINLLSSILKQIDWTQEIICDETVSSNRGWKRFYAMHSHNTNKLHATIMRSSVLPETNQWFL